MIIINGSYIVLYFKHVTHTLMISPSMGGSWKIDLLDRKRSFLSQTSMTSEDYVSSRGAAARIMESKIFFNVAG